MAVAATVERFLNSHHVAYDVVSHRHSRDSLSTAQAAHVGGDHIAKAVVLKDEDGVVVAVLPASYKLKMGEIHAVTGRRHLRLVQEDELGDLFRDCEVGAVPALGAAYGIETVWDESLALANPVYVEGGDYETLVQLSRDEFARIMGSSQSGAIGEPEEI